MNPVHEHRLRRWITNVISQEGYSLKRTSPNDPNFKRLGRWSRWEGLALVETHVDLKDLASRCAIRINAGIRRRDALVPPVLSFEPPNLSTDYVYKPPPEAPKQVKPVIPDPQGSLF